MWFEYLATSRSAKSLCTVRCKCLPCLRFLLRSAGGVWGGALAPMSEDGGNEQSSASVGRGGIDPMLNAKLTRRKVQQDVELMGNRIERLRAEERKAKQKVMETKLRGQEILQLQKRNQQAHAAKELAKRLEMEQHTRDQQSQQLRRIEHRAALKSTYEAMHAQRREEVKAERRIKAENAEMVAQTRAYERARAQKAQQAIRHHQKMVHERFDKQRQAHREFLAQDFINMISQEDKRREEIEHEIAAMEIDERSHIDRLRALQEEQKAAYDALEAALAS